MEPEGQSFIEIYRRYHQQIYRFIFAMIEHQETAEDLVQETFIKAYLSIDQIENKEKTYSWLVSVAKNTTIDYMRKRQKLQYECLTPPGLKYGGAVIEDQFIQEEGITALYQAMNQLKTNYRKVIILRKIRELTIKETAEVLNWKEDKVRITTTRAIKSLKKIWRKQYGDRYHLL